MQGSGTNEPNYGGKSQTQIHQKVLTQVNVLKKYGFFFNQHHT